MEAGSVTRKLAAILCADVEGYSRLMAMDEVGILRTLTGHRKLMGGLIAAGDGRVVGTAGDSVIAEFASVVSAVKCAVDIQEKLAERNAALPDEHKLLFRIGINLGDVIVQDEDLYGDGVNVAARLEALAEPGGVCISGSVYDQVKGKLPLPFDDLGPQRVKNIAEPVRTYRVRIAPQARSEALTLPDKPSIVVLPFENTSGDPEQEYFSDGITEDLITDLSKISALMVIARHSAFTYKRQPVKVQQVGRELGVRYVLEGSVRKAGNRVRITAQLIEAGTGGHLWAERYDRDLEDIFDLQDEVTQKIVAALEVKLTKGERQRRVQNETENLEAYDSLLRGCERFTRFTKEGVTEAKELYMRAIELDPTYAPAYAWLARTEVFEWISGWSEHRDRSLRRALELANKAVSLNDSLPLGHAILGWVYMWKKEHDRAIAEGEKAIALDPNDADAHVWLALSLNSAGRPEEALGLIEKAWRLNPRFPVLYLYAQGHAYFVMERYEDCISVLERGVLDSPNFLPNHLYLASCYGLLGREEEGRAEVAEMKRISPTYSLAYVQELDVFKDPRHSRRLVDGFLRVGLS
jgi:TolB-like protein